MAITKSSTFNISSKSCKMVKQLLKKILKEKSTTESNYQLSEEELQNLENELKEA